MKELLPVKLVPSADGNSYFLRQKVRLSRLRLAAGSESMGIRVGTYTRKTIEQLVYRGLVSQIEVESADLLQHRGEILELCGAVGAAALEAAYARDLKRLVEKSTASQRGSRPEIATPDARATARLLLADMDPREDSQWASAVALVGTVPR